MYTFCYTEYTSTTAIGKMSCFDIRCVCSSNSSIYRARKSRTTLQNKVRLKVLPEQLTLFVNTSVTLKKCIIQ